jgi:hypothetical protein
MKLDDLAEAFEFANGAEWPSTQRTFNHCEE